MDKDCLLPGEFPGRYRDVHITRALSLYATVRGHRRDGFVGTCPYRSLRGVFRRESKRDVHHLANTKASGRQFHRESFQGYDKHGNRHVAHSAHASGRCLYIGLTFSHGHHRSGSGNGGNLRVGGFPGDGLVLGIPGLHLRREGIAGAYDKAEALLRNDHGSGLVHNRPEASQIFLRLGAGKYRGDRKKCCKESSSHIRKDNKSGDNNQAFPCPLQGQRFFHD